MNDPTNSVVLQPPSHSLETNSVDFDIASAEWRKNKVSIGKGSFRYKCSVQGCTQEIYNYTTTNKYFDKFATEFDVKNKNHQQRFLFCEDHLLSNPDRPSTEQDPDRPSTEDPDRSSTEEPDRSSTEDPDRSSTEDPDRPSTEDPDRPSTEQDPDRPDHYTTHC